MIVTLSGDNDFLIKEELTKLLTSLGKTSGEMGVSRLSYIDSSLDNVRQAVTSYSLFSTNLLIILDEPSKISGFDEEYAQIFADLPDSSSLIIIEPSLDKRKSYYKYLLSSTDFKIINRLAITILVKWVIDYAESNGGKIGSQDASYLIERLSDDQYLLSQEITKLILYNKDITHDSIELLTEPSPSSTIFQLLEAAFNLNAHKALQIYNEQRVLKVEPKQILAMLSWQLQTLALYMSSKSLSQADVTTKSGLSPYTLTKARQIAAKLSYSNLKKLVSDLSYLDVASKSRSLDLDEGLKNFIVSLSY